MCTPLVCPHFARSSNTDWVVVPWPTQPLVPVDLFLPLLKATQVCQQQDAQAGGRWSSVEQLEAQVVRMPEDNRLLLEHLFCFLLNSGCDLWEAEEFQTLLARVWAPCMLRAPARIMGQFQGRVIDTMGHCVLLLLRGRAYDNSLIAERFAPTPTGSVDAPADCDEPPQIFDARISCPTAVPEEADLLGPLADSQSDCTAPMMPMADVAILQQQRCAADDLLSALEIMQEAAASDDNSTGSGSGTLRALPREASSIHEVAPGTRLASLKRLSETPDSSVPGVEGDAKEVRSEAKASGPTISDSRCCPPAACARLEAPPPPSHPHLSMLEARSDSQISAKSDRRCADSSRSARPCAYDSHSHRMARAATTALQAREAEAARLKQRAQRLLRERSALACELEGLHESLTRTDRAIARSKEQIAALRVESSRCSSSDSRRHSAQLSAMAKAISREKQRRLIIRNELVGAQRQLTKRRATHDGVATKLVDVQTFVHAHGEHQAQVEHGLREVQHLEQRLRQCRALLSKQDTSAPGSKRLDKHVRGACCEDSYRAPATSDEIHQVNQLLIAARHSIAEQREILPNHLPSHGAPIFGYPPLRAVAANREMDLAPSMRMELDRLERMLPSGASAAAEWRRRAQQLHHLLYQLWAHEKHAGDRSRLEVLDAQVVADAARWRAESQAFAAEARRVERAQERAEGARADEREGWFDFRHQVRSRGSADARDMGHLSASGEYNQLQSKLARSSEQLHGLRQEAQELRRSEDELRVDLLKVANKEASLERILLDLSAEM